MIGGAGMKANISADLCRANRSTGSGNEFQYAERSLEGLDHFLAIPFPAGSRRSYSGFSY
jgi:hypothetical protein